jgi:hypothetical protein
LQFFEGFCLRRDAPSSQHRSRMKMKFVNSRWSTAGVAAVAVLLSSFAASSTAWAHNICVIKFCDSNANGHRDPGEPLIGGWPYTITSEDGTSFSFSGETSANGPTCTQVPPGGYVVTEGTHHRRRIGSTRLRPQFLLRSKMARPNVSSLGTSALAHAGGRARKAFGPIKMGRL